MKTRVINIIIAISMIIAWSSSVAEDGPVAVFKYMRQLDCVKQNQPQMTAANTANDNSVVFDCDMNTELCQSWDDHVHSITHEVSADGTHLKTTYSSFMNGEHTKNSIYHFYKKM